MVQYKYFVALAAESAIKSSRLYAVFASQKDHLITLPSNFIFTYFLD